MKKLLVVCLLTLFAVSVYAEDLAMTPDGYLGRWSLDVWTGVSHNEASYGPSTAYTNFNNWMGGLNVMRPLSKFSTLYLDLSYIDMGHIRQVTENRLNRQTSAKMGLRFYFK